MFHLLIIFLATISTTTLHAKVNPRAQLINSIANQFCAAHAHNREQLPQEGTAPVTPEKPKPFTFAKWKNIEISHWEKWHRAFDLLFKHLEKTDIPVSSIIDSYLLKKMEFFLGGEVHSNTLFKRIDRTHSHVGKACLSWKLISPQTNITTLKNDQAIVRELVQQNKIRKNLNSAFEAIAQTENSMLLLWVSNDWLIEMIINNNYSAFDRFNKNSTYLHYSQRIQSIIETIGAGFMGTCIVTFPIMGYIAGERVGAACGLAYSLSFTLIAAVALNQIELHRQAIKHLTQITFAYADYIAQCKKVDAIIQNNPELMRIPCAQLLHEIVSGTASTLSDDFKEILYNFSTETFTEKPSANSHHGRILATYYMLTKTKDEFIPLMMAMGEVETYLSVAKLYKEHEKQPAHYTFVDFVTGGNTPIMEATNFWNPFVAPQEVVLNSLSLGTTNNPRNTIITGPNTGGKSTVIKALLIDVLMAQAFGIAPAHKMKMTPFNVINCYINITDDIATGASLFKAEVLRVKTLLNFIKALPAGVFSFTIMDEIFSGTSPKEGEEAAFLCAQKLARFKNSMAIIATHFTQLTTLPEATENQYSNYHVEVIRNEDRTLTRTFLLKQGPSYLNVAMDILHAEGILDI